MDVNIVFNPNFKLGLRGWKSNCCNAHVSSGKPPGDGNSETTEAHLACAVTHRTEIWQGLEQELTPRLKENLNYRITVLVRILNTPTMADVRATLRVETPGAETKYLPLGKIKASNSSWSELQGQFFLISIPKKAVFYIEGPPPGVDFLVKYVDIRPCTSSELDEQLGQQYDRMKIEGCSPSQESFDVVLQNSNFEQGLDCWYGKCCNILLLDSSSPEKNGLSKNTLLATNRTSSWQGLEQDVTGRVKGKRKYEVSASVRLRRGMPSADVLATLWMKDEAQKDHYITLCRATASSSGWVQLKGMVLLNQTPCKATAYIEGPPAGIDLLINNFSMFYIRKPAPIRPIIPDPMFGMNIVENSNFSNELEGWTPLGECSLSLSSGAPLILPRAARDSLGCMSLTGNYVTAKNRKYIWEGPSQNISTKVKLFVTYQVSAWVRVGYGGVGPQKVSVTLGVDGQWVNGGEIEGDPTIWKEIAGSFRFEKKPEDVLLYVQGPSAHVDVMVANLIIFAVDRPARFDMLKAQTEKVRKQDTIIQIKDKKGRPLSQVSVKIEQKKNSFPLGCCINSYSTNNESYMDFFFATFNWAVFENELKWYWTEKECKNINYKEADELCNLCMQHGVRMRGHCIFWETDDAVQDWIKKLTKSELATCVQNRLIDLVSRFQGKFDHYDVNNEMLHGSFFKTRLGPEIIPYMFQLAQQLDPSVKLFLNDYHVVDGCDVNSSPEKYIHQARELQRVGAPVGGIGVQGHITFPVGAIIAHQLDKLAMAGLPIWFTEVDVESANEFLRSDDLEVVLREAFAHPAVEGFMLWGFMESAMHRPNAHLVDAEGTVNEAGKMLLALQREWLTQGEGKTDEGGCFGFRGYHGTYTVTFEDARGKKHMEEFEVCKKGEAVLVVDIIV
ncbi:hypothetical protein L7F22_032706 [Adiantum nelumboides]|nr:hypothetical protein [Adiantum nelumboides]